MDAAGTRSLRHPSSPADASPFARSAHEATSCTCSPVWLAAIRGSVCRPGHAHSHCTSILLGYLLHSSRVRVHAACRRDGRAVDMLSASDTIQRLGGVARGAQLQGLGFDRRTLARKVDAGEIERLRPGVFASGRVPDDIRTAVAHGGAATCVTVLRAHGVWTLPTVLAVHVWLGPGRHGHPHPDCQCVAHYYRGHRPLAAASLAVALIHVRRCSGDEAFFAAYESAWRLGKLSKATRARIRAALPENARWLVDLARPDADSGLESLLRLRLHLLGIRLDCQVTIDGVGRVDFVIGGRLILEADGRSNHDDMSHRHKDLVRDAAASARGYETLRFDYAQIVHDWPEVQKSVLAAIRRSSER